MSRYLLLVMCIIFTDCTNSPRYGNSSGTGKKSKTRNLKTAKHIPKVITGVSSYYGTDFHGKLTANGEVYDMYGLTAAHKTLPLNTTVRVTNLANNKSLILRINDRGPTLREGYWIVPMARLRNLIFFCRAQQKSGLRSSR